MTALEFRASLNPDGTVKVPPDVVSQIRTGDSFRVLLLVPTNDDDVAKEDAAWDRLTESEFFRGYADSDSIYDDV